MEKDIGKIKKNDISDIIIRVDDFNGKRGLTIREFVTSDRYTGFTKAGVRILAENFPKFKEMINSIPDEDMKDEVSEEKKELEPGQETLNGSIKEPEEKTSSDAGLDKKPKEDLPDY